MTTPSAVTFVGTGTIGMPMAVQLTRKGFTVRGVDPAPDAAARGAEHGITIVPTLESSPWSPTIVVMVASPAQLDELVGRAIAHGRLADQTWVVMSTVGPEAVRTQAQRLRDAGAGVVDAPVTGGVARAATGELTIFASGATADIERVRPVLAALGDARVVGPLVGDGQAIKVINQHLCSIHIVAAAEALALATRLGLDASAVLPLVESGAAGSWMLSDRGPRMLGPTDVPVASQIDIFVKDTGLVSDAAAQAGLEVPLLDAARERYLIAARLGLGRRDDSRVIETYQADIDPVALGRDDDALEGVE